MQRYALTLDLKPDSTLIAQYLEHHRQVWPEIVDSIRSSGIICMDIYHVDTRLFMLIEVEEDFSFDRKAALDRENSKVHEWEKLMDRYQQRLPFARSDEKWVLMENIFHLDKTL